MRHERNALAALRGSLLAASGLAAWGLLGPASAQSLAVAPGGPQHQLVVQSSGLAPVDDPSQESVHLMDEGLLISVDEVAQGRDLNGDGLLRDGVLGFFDATTGERVNLGLVGRPDRTRARVALVVLPEGPQGVDYNGDGDTLDEVMGVFRPGIGLDVLPWAPRQRVLGGDDWVFFEMDERRNGNQDFNQDGDALDTVVHAYRISTKELFNTRANSWAGGSASFQASGGRCGFVSSEAEAGGQDLNGNGTATDLVIFFFDAPSKRLLNTKYPTTRADALDLGDRWAVFAVNERLQGELDLNADGDAEDEVLFAHELGTDTFRNLGISTETTLSVTPLVLGNRVLFRAYERDHGDLNGDGDERDLVAFVHDLEAGETTCLGIAAGEMLARGPFFVIAVDEALQGEDLNGDGDEVDTDVLHVYDVVAGELTNMGIATSSTGPVQAEVSGGRVLALARELSQGPSDLNGDGDTLDQVLFVYDPRDGEVRNVGLATVDRPLGSPDLAYFRVSESDQGDLNGDGDALDVVAFVYLRSEPDPFVFGPGDPALDVQGPAIAVVRLEAEVGQDLNGDGDLNDPIAFRYAYATRRP